MRVTEMDLLFAYNWWATARILDAASGLSDEDFTRTDVVPIPHGSLRSTLVHTLDVERSTRLRLSRNMSAGLLEEASFSTIDELARTWRAEATAMKDYLIGLEDEHMDSVVAIDEDQRYPYWQLLMHVLTHSTQHRSEAAATLSALGRTPGDLDFYLFLREASQ